MMKKIVALLFLVLPLTMVAQDLQVVASANEHFENITSVYVSGEFCKINIISGDAIYVKGELKATKQLEGYAIAFSEEAGELKVNVQKPKSGWTTHSGIVDITLPDGVNLNVVTSSGYITLNGISSSIISAQSKSGKIIADNLEGKVTLKAKSASVKVNTIKGQLSMSTKGGAQVARNIDGAASFYSGSGALLIENIKGALKTETTDGAQTIKEVDGEIYLKTMSGAMKLSNASGNVKSLSAAGTLNLFDVTGVFNLVSTKGAIIGTRVKLSESSSFQTTEGKIKLKMLNSKESLSFVCESEHAYIVAFGKSKKKKLKTGSGAIVVTSVSTTGAQSYY